jgi:two-component system NtrC family sensor kinase
MAWWGAPRRPRHTYIREAGVTGTALPANNQQEPGRPLERWTQQLFEAIGDAIFVHDLEGNILYANSAACRQLGYSREELLRLNTRDIDDPEFAAGFAERLAHQLAEGHYRCEGRHRTRDGRILEVDINTTFVEIDGRPCVLAVMRDISARKRQEAEHARIEEELRQSQAFYHSLVESLPLNLLRKDREGRFTFGNQRFCNELGVSREELIGKTDFDFFPEALARKYREDDQRVLATGVPFETVEEHLLPSGEMIYVQVIKTPIRSAEGDILGIQCLFWDVTERRRAEEALARSERRYRQLTEATLDAIIVTDQEGRIELFNPAAERMFGYQATEVLGQSVSLLIPERYRSAHEAGLRRYVNTRQPHLIGRPVELTGRRKDGSEFPVELALSAFDLGEEGGFSRLQFLGALRDLTERNRLRAILIQNEKLASIGLLSAGVAHEINNPLAFVSNNLAVLQRDCKGLMALVDLYESGRARWAVHEPELAARAAALAADLDLAYVRDNLDRLLSRTREGLERVSRIVHSLRGLARTDRPQLQEVSLADLVGMALDILRGRLKRAGIILEQDYPADLRLRCVPTQISQVLLNLLLNAAQAIEAAGRQGQGRIRLSAHQEEERLVLAVEDNGCGIPPEHLPRLFDPFFTTKEVGEGTGLGLSICHNIISAHGGEIQVESTPGQGTTFRVLLPQAA